MLEQAAAVDFFSLLRSILSYDYATVGCPLGRLPTWWLVDPYYCQAGALMSKAAAAAAAAAMIISGKASCQQMLSLLLTNASGD